MKRAVILGWLLAGVVVFAGSVAGIGMGTATDEMTTSNAAQIESNTPIPETTDQTANVTPGQQRAITNQSGRNQSNVTVQINSTTLSGQNCSVSVATTGNVTIPLAKSGNETVATTNVSAGWLVYTNRVERVNEQVNERLPEWVSNTSAVRSTGISQSNNTTVQGESVTRVVVGVAPGQVDEIRDEIPRQINCVEIAVRPMGRAVALGGASASSNESTVINANISDRGSITVMTATATNRPTPSETTDTADDSTTTSSTGPGFGIGATVVAVCALVFVRRRG